MKGLLIATKNSGKLKEFTKFFSSLPVKIVSLKDIEDYGEVEENEPTYKDNSKKKALFYAQKSGLPAIADDGGIEIDALDGAPGLKSRRWLGKDSTEEDIIKHMTKLGKELPENKRGARFITVVTLALPNGKTWSQVGIVNGKIAKKPLTKYLEGYPYRSFFYIPEINRYYHEMDLSPEEEKLYNHRYKAVQKLKPIIHKVLQLK